MNDGLCLDDATRDLLARFGFDREAFDKNRKNLVAGSANANANRLQGTVEKPATTDVSRFPALGTAERQRLAAIGNAAIARGEVAAVVLAGGMATRFGGVVKAAVEVLDGRSFLDLKLSDICGAAKRGRGRVPAYLMTSFATDAAVRELASAYPDTHCFAQLISLRLTPDGELFREDDGSLSPYAPGHGDLTFALRRSEYMARFRDSGGKYMYMSNVDNLTATLDPGLLGAHIESGAKLTAEVSAKEEGDAGGAPARVDGHLQIVESFRFPETFDQDTIPVFNTNSFMLDAAAIDRDFDLTWFAVTKNVEGRAAVQFEHLVGELTAFLPSHFVAVERAGPDARFQPIKTPEELNLRRQELREALGARDIL